jgi:hypothetical protein
VGIELKPEPEPKEREAIEVALQRLLARGNLPAAYTSAWRQAGIRTAVEDQAAARPRSSFGATRA